MSQENDNYQGSASEDESVSPVPPPDQPESAEQPDQMAPPPPPQNAGTPPPPPQGNYSAGQPGGPVYGTTGATPGDLMNPTKDERNWAMFSHLSGFVVAVVTSAIGMPMLGFLGPLVIYLMKKDESPFVADQAKEALNFYISVSIIALILFVLSLTVILVILTLPLLLVLGIGALVLSIMAAIRASNGELYRYPFTLRLIQ